LLDNEEVLLNGTSVASAYISGVATLILNKNSKLSPREVKKRIDDTVIYTFE
jgi:subtilisin family serine protease